MVVRLAIFHCSLLIASLSFGQSPEHVLRAYEQVHNAHEVERILEYYVHDVKFELVGVWSKSGIVEMRELAEWDAALNSNLDFHIEAIREDSLICSVLERNDWFKAIDIDPLVHDRVIVVIQNGLIHHIKAYPSLETSQRIGKTIQEIVGWAQTMQNETINELFKNEQFIYLKYTAHQWMNLLNEWNKR